MEVYTMEYNAWRMGGNLWQPIKTSIEDYEDLPLGGQCIVFHNPIKDLWHVAVVKCGAIVGTAKTREAVIAQVKADLETADPKVVAKQIEDALPDFNRAKFIERDTFFALFKS